MADRNLMDLMIRARTPSWQKSGRKFTDTFLQALQGGLTRKAGTEEFLTKHRALKKEGLSIYADDVSTDDKGIRSRRRMQNLTDEAELLRTNIFNVETQSGGVGALEKKFETKRLDRKAPSPTPTDMANYKRIVDWRRNLGEIEDSMAALRKGKKFKQETGTIHVRLKSTGQTGSIEANIFDSKLYEKIK